mmetsp:Transcript_4239/g.5584  ORF Transcript_4239/g.5584 Transcript_4239/m.5584 type:complete len:1041 (-) Transcript_4239:314-3436(-)
MQTSRISARCCNATLGRLRRLQAMPLAMNASSSSVVARCFSSSQLLGPGPGPGNRRNENEVTPDSTFASRRPYFQRQRRLFALHQRRAFTSQKHGRFRDHKGFDPKPNEKESFTKIFLDPASRGELKKGNSSGIPRLAARKPKGNLKVDMGTTTKRTNRGRAWQQFSDSPEDERLVTSPSAVEAMRNLTAEDFTDEEIEELREEMTRLGMDPNVDKSEIAKFAQEMGQEQEQMENENNNNNSAPLGFGGGGFGGDGGELEARSKWPSYMSEEARKDKFFAEELWDDKKYWWKEEDYDTNLFVDDDFDFNDYTNKEGVFEYEYDPELREDPFLKHEMDGDIFDFDFNQALEMYKQQATPEELREVQNLDMAKMMKESQEETGGNQSHDQNDQLTGGWTEEDLKYLLEGCDGSELDDTDFELSQGNMVEGNTIEGGAKDFVQDGKNNKVGNYQEGAYGLPEGSSRLLDRDFKQKKMEPDPETFYFNTQNNIIDIVARDDSEFPDKVPENPYKNDILPLADSLGSGGVEDFVQTMLEHPSDYARISYEIVHPNSKREPQSIFADDPDVFKQPSDDFVKKFYRFLYVTNLPPISVDGELGDIENAEHKSLFEKSVAKLCNVDSTQVSVASATSAVVGFKSPRELADALKNGPTRRTLEEPPQIKKFPGIGEDDSDELKAFVEQASQNSIMFLKGLRLDLTEETLAKLLIPLDSGLSQEFGIISADDVCFLPSRGSALIRLESAEKLEALRESPLLPKRLQEMGTYSVQFLRARRELLHEKVDSVDKTKEIRVMGPNLMVDGLHMPWKEFYLSHASALQIQNLPPGIQKNDLTKIFQQYSKGRRDAKHSIQFVNCELSGEPILNIAYIGFDEPDEAMACVNNFEEGKMKIGNHETQLIFCKDRAIPYVSTDPHTRTTRTIEELNDDLNNWEKYVDPKDVEYLDENGVPRVILDEILRGIRRTNVYFGPLNSPIEDESIEPKSAGELYKEVVVMYVETLKECVATPNDPGELFLEQFFPGQEPDLSVFDKWKEEKAKIESSRAKLL